MIKNLKNYYTNKYLFLLNKNFLSIKSLKYKIFYFLYTFNLILQDFKLKY